MEIKTMDMTSVQNLIRSICGSEGVDPELAIAIAWTESNFDTGVVRYERGYPYSISPEKYAARLLITEETEKLLQSMSWNVFQVMGATARECGLTGHLTSLVNPSLGILYGVKYIKVLTKRFADEKDVISSYNQGGPYRDKNGDYKNQQYVNDVTQKLIRLRQLKKR
jgi:soluble lytic murein transglycosylase-like protein